MSNDTSDPSVGASARAIAPQENSMTEWNPDAVDIPGLVSAANTHVALCRQSFEVSHRLAEQLKAAFWEGARWYQKSARAIALAPPEHKDEDDLSRVDKGTLSEGLDLPRRTNGDT